jgi:ABC-type branched-subunit amino acid transport system permease subunit
MKFVGKALKAIGWFLVVGPLSLFVAIGAYVIVANPADQAGWGAVIGTIMIIAMAVVPAGLLILLLGFALTWLNTKDKSAAPS